MTAQFPYNNPYQRKAPGGGYVNRYNNPIVTSNSNEYLADAQTYAATKMFTGIEVTDNYALAESGFPVNAFRDYKAAYQNMLQQERDKLAESIRSNPDGADEAIRTAQQEVLTKEEGLQQESLGKYYDIVIQDPEIAEQDEFTRQTVAARLFLNTQMARIADGAGLKDWAGAILVPDMSMQTAEFLGEFGDESAVHRYFNSAEGLAEIGKMYNALPPEQKFTFVEEMGRVLPGITNNKLKQLEILMGATGQTGQDTLEAVQFLDKFDAITLGLSGALKAGSVAMKASRGMNPVRALTKGGNKDIAGVAADEVLTTPEKARKVGITADEAAYSADPRQIPDLNDLMNGAPEGVSTNVRNKLEAIDNLVEESNNILDQGLGLDQAERLRIQESRIKNLEDKLNLQDVKVVSSNDQGYNISYKTLDKDGNEITQVDNYAYTVDDVTGTFLEKESNIVAQTPILKNIIGAGVKAGNDKNRLLYGYEQIDFASRKMGGNLKEAFNQATKGLGKGSIAKLNNILLKGDETAQVYNYNDLVNVGVGGVRLTEKEFASYVGTRRVIDNLWQAKNSQMRRDLRAQGIKDVNVGGVFYKAKPYDSVDSAKTAYRELPGTSIRVDNPPFKEHSSGVITNLTPEDLDNYYSLGYKLVRANDSHASQLFPSEAVGNSAWALVHTDGISDLGPVVLNYRNGYVPRNYDKSHYFLKKQNYAMVDGSPVATGTSTLRYFDNIDDAEKYKRQLQDAAEEAGEAFDPDDYAVLGDREMTSADLDNEVTAMWGGLYSGTRTQEGIKFGLAGTEGTRISAIESIQDYMEHVATRYPMSQYRMGMERRWLNSARQVVPELKNFTGGFREARGYVEGSSMANSAAKTKLLNAHDQIDFMNRTPTVGEDQTAGAMKQVVDSMSRFTVGGKQPLKPFAKYMGGLNKADPVAAARTGAFHMYLGFYNPAQFVVQGLGASVAISMSPVHAARGITKFPGFVILDGIKDPKARRIQMKTFQKKFGDNFEEAYEAWQKSGLYESAMVTNADAYTLHKGLPISQGAMGKLLEGGTFFFKQGELVNLRTSFLTAYQKWKATAKPGTKLDDAELKKILAETEKFRLHMTNANKGDFQKGIMSVPTQFMQISVRYAEALMGKELTRTEKASFLLGQAALFGAAGVPLGKAVFEGLADQLGVDVNEMSPEDQIKVQRGMLGWMLNDYMDIDAAFTSRVAIGQGLTDTLKQFLAGEDTTLPDMLLGPFGGVVDQSLKAYSDAAFARQGIISADDLTSEDILMLSTTIAESLANIPSSTRNLMKAMYLRNSGAYRDKQGNLIMANPDVQIRDQVAQALGFGSQDIADFWEIVIDNRAIETAKKESVDLIMRNYMRMFEAANNNDDKQQRAFTLMLKTTYSLFPDPKDRNEVLQSVFNRIQNGNTRLDQEVRKHIEWLGSELGKDANSWVPLLNKYREEREARSAELQQ